MDIIKKILDLLTPVERKQAGVLMGMMMVMALLDMLGVASVLPFIAVLANPSMVETNPILSWFYEISSNFGVDSKDQFLFFLGFIVFALLVFSLTFKALTAYAQLRFTLMREYSIGKRLVEGYLHQPYSWFLSRHSADMGKTILSEVKEIIDRGINPMMSLIAHAAVSTALLTLLILVDPELALIAGLTLAATYSLITIVTRAYLTRIGKERVSSNQVRFTVLSEAFSASKEVKIGGLEQIYINRFAGPAQIYARHQASAQIISQMPRYVLEAIAFGGMLLVVLYLMAQSGSFASALPIIALYAFAGYRLLPALQQIYGAVTQLRFVGPALDALHTELMSLQPTHPNPSQYAVSFNKAITLDNIHFRYPNARHQSIKGLTLNIPAKSIVGLVGTTGSGKTTTVDLILGLLEAQQGKLTVDGQDITEHNHRAWQRFIGYVPQQIYLADDTVAGNIAFGLDAKDIDQESVVRAAKIANLHDFVVNEMPQQYKTTVGERGVRLSGGQRQRIGIARALYHNPMVLILDEATSALDNLTEQAVMEALRNLGHEITIILIAHRLSTVKVCDTIFLLEKGELKAQGTYEELSQNNHQFKAMAELH